MKLFGKPLELVILDVDGVIVDLLANFWRNLEVAAEKCGLSFEPIKKYREDVAAGVSGHYPTFMEMLHALWPGLDHGVAKKFFNLFRLEEARQPYPACDGSVEVLKWLRGRDIPLVLCTTNEKEALERRLEAININLAWFSAMSTWESPYRKPNPRTLDHIFELVPVPREHAVYLGDWWPDLECARGGGVRFLAVLSGGIPKHAFLQKGVPNDHILGKLSDFPKLLEE